MTKTDRRTIVTLSFMLVMSPSLAFADRKRPVVLFICEFGTAKSAIARELLRRRAKARGIAVTALSRGLQIEDHVSPPLRLALNADGIDSRRDGFAILAKKDVQVADTVVTFVRLPDALRPRDLRDWSAVPSVNDAWPAARADLDRRIDALLDQIVASRGGTQ